jgi:hypothetical protein
MGPTAAVDRSSAHVANQERQVVHVLYKKSMQIFSNILAKAKRLMKKVMFASARCSAKLATLNPSISKLSGSGWVQKVDNLECHRSDVSEIKLKRTDTTLEGC